MNIALFEDVSTQHLLPLTWLRPACVLRCGRTRLIDKIRRHVGDRIARIWTRPELRAVAEALLSPTAPDRADNWCLLNARAMITGDVTPPDPGVAWVDDNELIAVGLPAARIDELDATVFQDKSRLTEWASSFKIEDVPPSVRLIRYPWELVHANEAELIRECVDGGAIDGTIDAGVHVLQADAICIGSDSRVRPGVVLDAEAGPIHIDKNVLIEPNAVIQGPCSIGPDVTVRPGATIREGTTIGPVCKVGGEIEASIFQGYSNKQHDGFLGHSFIASWVNLGADTVTSDLKNTYGSVRVFLNGVGIETGQTFVGSTIGDHSKTGIGTILPTGCVIGVAANVFTQGPVPKFVPSFAWLTDTGMTEYRIDKAIQIARTVMGRRNVALSDVDRALLQHVATAARQVEAAGWS